MQELTCLVHFYITTLTLLYSLRLQGGGGVSTFKTQTHNTVNIRQHYSATFKHVYYEAIYIQYRPVHQAKM